MEAQQTEPTGGAQPPPAPAPAAADPVEASPGVLGDIIDADGTVSLATMTDHVLVAVTGGFRRGRVAAGLLSVHEARKFAIEMLDFCDRAAKQGAITMARTGLVAVLDELVEMGVPRETINAATKSIEMKLDAKAAQSRAADPEEITVESAAEELEKFAQDLDARLRAKASAEAGS